jgi:Uma2 family endonuclease
MLQEMLEFARAPRVLVSAETFERLAAENDLLQLERTAEGHLVVLPPAGGQTASFGAELTRQLGNWNARVGLGVCFDSSAGFTLSNGAIRSPDASWIRMERWASVREDLRERFAPIDPDFAIELGSPSDSMREVRTKVRDYLECNVGLTWIINPRSQTVEVYRPGVAPETIRGARSIGAEPELPGFVLDLRPIFDRL